MDGSCHAKTSTDYKLQGYLPETKNGKKRTVPISEELEKKLKRRPALNYSKLIMRSFAGFYAE